jgi:hypothetical protein
LNINQPSLDISSLDNITNCQDKELLPRVTATSKLLFRFGTDNSTTDTITPSHNKTKHKNRFTVARGSLPLDNT